MTERRRIQRPPAMTPAQYACADKRVWWVRDLDTRAWALPRPNPPACEPLDCWVPPGRYEIGAGGPECYREVLDTEERPAVAPCITRHCSGVVAFTVERGLARVDVDEAGDPIEPPPSGRLCESCRERG